MRHIHKIQHISMPRNIIMMRTTNSAALMAFATGLVLLAFCEFATGYKPVVIVHGVFDGPPQMQDLHDLIVKAHPETNVTIPDLYDEFASLTPLWLQLPDFRKSIENVMLTAKEGINLICFSQGGILCRALLANMSDHNVNTFIALSTPQMGQYGDTSYVPLLPKLKEDVYKVCYNSLGQNTLSVCNYWNDPHHRSEYLSENIFLPVINNETANSNSQIWKDNFLRIKRMILIGGPDDGVITPWQSSHFGFYNEKEEIVEMQKQEVFVKDWFGLQTLYKRGGIKTFNISGVEHTKWHGNQTVFDCCIEPYLT